MGICKCKRRTDLYCFVHIKPVCENCIVDHKVCHVRTYHEWLTSSEYPAVTCGHCKQGLFDTEPVVRLKCLDLFHPGCISEALSKVPADNLSTVGCPSCGTTIIPHSSDASALAEQIRTSLQPLLPSSHTLQSKSHQGGGQSSFSESRTDTSNSNQAATPVAPKLQRTRIDTPAYHPHSSGLDANPSASTVITMPSADPFVPANRKPSSKSSRSESHQVDYDDDKYGRKNILDTIGLRQLMKRLAACQRNPVLVRRAALGVIVLALFLLMWLIMSSLASNED